MNVTIDAPVQDVLRLIELLSASLRPKPGMESPKTSVLCARCHLLVEVEGPPNTSASVFGAAERIGWTVRGVRCFCPTCLQSPSTNP